MAEKNLVRRILAIFDRASARKAEAELEASLGAAGAKGGENFLRELKKQFETRTADLKVALAKGVIDEKEFRKQADLAAKQFNAGILAGMQEARAAGTLTEREYQKLAKTLKKTGADGETAFGRMRAAAIRLGAAMAAAFTLRRLVDFGKGAVKAALDSGRAWTNLAGSVRAAGVDFATVEPKLRAAADQFERVTAHDDDEFAETLQRLIALTDDYSASLQNVGLVADVAARFFDGQLEPAADLVGKAMMGNVRALKQLGIDAKDAQGALDELAERSMGAAAERANSLEGRVAQLNVAWGNFQKAVGQLIIQAGGGTSAIDVLTAAVRAMTKALTDNVGAVKTAGSVLKWFAFEIVTRSVSLAFIPLAAALTYAAGAYALLARGAALAGKGFGANTSAIDEQIKKADELTASLAKLTGFLGRTIARGVTPSPFGDVTGGSSTTAGGGRPAVVSDVDEAAEKAAETAAKKRADQLKDIEREIDVQNRRAQAVLEGKAAVEALNRELFIEQQILEAGVAIGSAAADEIRARAAVLYDATQVVEMLGKDGLEAANGLEMLKNAFEKGGVAGAFMVAKTAILRVKEHGASMISEGAKALGALASGNFGAAATHAASAIKHGLALNEWRKLAMGGGGGGGSGHGGAGAMAAGSATGLDKGGSVEAPGTEVHIYMDPLSPQDPRVQSFVHETNRQVTERFGSNANVTWHPRTAS